MDALHANPPITIYPPSPFPPSLTSPNPSISISQKMELRKTEELELIPSGDYEILPSSISEREESFLWTEQRVRAVTLLADGRYTHTEICQMIGTTLTSLAKWERNNLFQSRLENILKEYSDKVLQTGIAVKINRLKELNHRHSLLNRVVHERSLQAVPDSDFYDPSLSKIPGLGTGIVTTEVKSVRTDEGFFTYHVSSVDTALLNEFRKTEEQAARETGQWAETHNVNILQKAYIGIDISAV